MIDGPAQQGLDRANWTYAELADHLRHVGRRYPAPQHPRVVLLIDKAPWHAGEPIRQALAANPYVERKRLPSYSPQLNPSERFGKVLHRRATHNRLFDTMADLRRSLRASRYYFQSVRDRVRTLLDHQPKKRTTQTGT